MAARKIFMRNPWNTYLGDCSLVDAYLARRPMASPRWFPLHFLSIFLRSVGQAAFVNNPLLGIFFLAAFFLLDWEAGMGCILGGGVATLTEILLGLHPWSLVSNGVAPFNGVLVGTVIPIVYPGLYGVERTSAMWVAITLGAITSVFFCSAFNNFLGKLNIPYLALPFNIIIICTFLTLAPHSPSPPSLEIQATAFNSSTMQEIHSVCGHLPYADSLSWCGVGRGIIVSMGQVYAVNHVMGSLLIYLAVMLSSPLLFTMSILGATIGTLTSLTFVPVENYQEIYDGIWGYNALLAMAAVSCVFFPFSPASFVAGLINTIGTVAIHAALRASMDKINMPVFTVPITMCTLIMLLSSQSRPCGCGSPLQRTEVMSYPEKQALQAWRKAKKNDYQECAADEKDDGLIEKV